MRKQTIINRVEAIITSVVTQDIEIPLLMTEGIIAYDAIVGVNYDHSPTSLILGFKAGVAEYLVSGEASPLAGKPVATSQSLFIPSVYKPFVRVVGGTLGDKIALFIYGTYYDTHYPINIVSIETE